MLAFVYSPGVIWMTQRFYFALLACLPLCGCGGDESDIVAPVSETHGVMVATAADKVATSEAATLANNMTSTPTTTSTEVVGAQSTVAYSPEVAYGKQSNSASSPQSNAAGSSQSVSGSINRQTSPIILQGVPPVSATVGASYAFAPTVAGGSGPITFVIKGQPTWMSLSSTTGAVTGIPVAASVGESGNITIMANNGSSTATIGPFAVHVLAAPAAASTSIAPTISGIPASSVVAGVSYLFTPNVTNASGAALTFTILNVPSWATYSSSNGTLSGTPTTANVGTYSNIIITVSDGTHLVNLPFFAITVTQASINEISARERAIQFGAVGHNDRSTSGSSFPYNSISLSTQMKLLNTLGLNSYRTSCEISNCATLISAAAANGINILKSIELKPSETLTESENYERGYTHGATEVTSVGDAFKYFEAGNELDNWVGMKGDGSKSTQYDESRYVLARGFIRGLIDGVHSADPTAKVLVDDAGWCHYGFLQMLWSDGVRWDITAFHWYASQGNLEHAGCSNANVAEIHAAFGVPVWLTEFNSNVAAKDANQADAASWLTNTILQLQAISSKYGIQKAFIYELFDEPAQPGMQGNFGLFDGNGNPKLPGLSVAHVLGIPPI
jgi:hypothetical protein